MAVNNKKTDKNPAGLAPSKEFVIKGGNDADLWGDIDSDADKSWSSQVWKSMVARAEEHPKVVTKASTPQSLAHSLVASRLDEAKRLAETVIKPSKEENETAVTTKHLAGRHNQKNHGNRQGKPAVGSDLYMAMQKKAFKKAPPEFVKKSLVDSNILNTFLPNDVGVEMIDFIYTAYNYEDKESGIRTDVTSIEKSGDRLSIEGKIYNSDGKRIGIFLRHIDSNGSVDHSYLSVNKNSQGNGFGKRFYQNQEDSYAKLGIKEIKIHANLDVGGYAWARMGFDFADQESFMNISTSFWNKYVSVYGDRPPTFPDHAWEIAAYKGPDGRPIGKEFMLGSNWNATKSLAQDSDGYKVGQDYYASK